MKFKQWLSLPLAAALLAAAPAMAAEKFRVGYLRVMDDAQAIVAQEG
ncbi:MAG: ABC transporter substrate-binding protein, partial [Achromobacter spanius]